MTKLQQTQEILQNHKSDIENQFHVKQIGIFGSVTRGEENENSDIDILVEFSKPVGFFTFLKLEEYLKNKLKADIDLVSKKALKPVIGKQILQEVIFI